MNRKPPLQNLRFKWWEYVTFLFGNERYKADLLSLYNALNDTSYTDVEQLEINTIDDVVYMKMKNDVSCIIKSNMSLYEQQSTFNPNMPIRGFMYFSKLYDKWIMNHNCNLYGSKMIKIPTPQYYVFYIGSDKHDDREYLRLSDLFDTEDKVQGFEWTATMLNINQGYNEELLNRCQALRDYSEFVESVRENVKQYKDLSIAIDKSIQTFKQRQGTLAEVLRNNEAEVKEMCITEYNEEATLNAMKEEGREDKLRELVQKKLAKGQSVQQIAEALEETEESIKNIIQQLQR